ncbi:glycosyltransferase [Mesorhizobium sp. M1005]|uniref:glycosyltransferase family 2 protein n=1 Tax=unclassified Mesorhizobium TaxID=325217 RepID=UPI00333759CA
MKVSIVTAVYNRRSSILQALESVDRQSHRDLEHIVVDGMSTDGTVELIREKSGDRTIILSERDDGIYDALNKGIKLSTGGVIGLMHSDDVFAHNHVIERVCDAFRDQSIDAVYGDLQYVSAKEPSRVVRHWRAGSFSQQKLAWGWMPPHPTLYLRRSVFERFGAYDTRYRIAADYDAVLRYFGKGNIRSAYIPEVMVKMRTGGESNRSIKSIVRKSVEDYRALRANDVGGILTLILKNISKLRQFEPTK